MAKADVAFRLLRWCATRRLSEPIDSGRSAADGNAVRAFLRSRDIDSLYALACEQRDSWQAAYDAVWRHQLAALREALEALVQAGVRVLTFKGGELIPRHFPTHALGFLADVDLLVPRDQLELARSVLYKLDYRHADLDPERGELRDRDLRELAQIELQHYELAPFAKLVELSDPAVAEVAKIHDSHPLHLLSDHPVAVIEIDLHHNLAADLEAEMFFARAVPSSLGVGETFSPADHVWFNLTRYYNEVALHGKVSLRPFAYTLPEISSAQVDWGVVESVAAELELGPTLYYFLAFCDRLAPGRIPASTLEAVRTSTTSRYRDWGWQLGKLFGFEEEFPSYAFAGGEVSQTGGFQPASADL